MAPSKLYKVKIAFLLHINIVDNINVLHLKYIFITVFMNINVDNNKEMHYFRSSLNAFVN